MVGQPDAGRGTFKFVDPEGVRSEVAHDLSVPMREYNLPLLAGDTKRLVRERAELLASLCEVDPEPVWQWGFIANVRDFPPSHPNRWTAYVVVLFQGLPVTVWWRLMSSEMSY